MFGRLRPMNKQNASNGAGAESGVTVKIQVVKAANKKKSFSFLRDVCSLIARETILSPPNMSSLRYRSRILHL